jgi:hypothetical protein
VVGGLGLWIAIGMSWVEFKDRPINDQCEFSSIIGVIFFTSVFMALTMSKNYEIRRVAKCNTPYFKILNKISLNMIYDLIIM